jgi:hypothetical protein
MNQLARAGGLPDRVIAAIEEEIPCRHAAAGFRVSASSAVRWRSPDPERLVFIDGTGATTRMAGRCRSYGGGAAGRVITGRRPPPLAFCG